MKLALFLILIIILVVSNAQAIKNSRIKICKKLTLFSEILNEKRKIWVYLPNCLEDQSNPKHRYPVVYLLDAEEHFRSFTEMIQRINEADGSREFPDMIVIGIPNTRRSRDLTPSYSVYDADGNIVNDFSVSGGGEKFIAFIKNELMPYINSLYPTAPYRIFAGHSLGGLTVVNTLLNHQDMFDGYIASDPSMWWDGKLILEHTREMCKQKRFDERYLYLSIANTMPSNMNIEQLQSDTSKKTNHIRSILELADILKNNTAIGLNFDYKYYSKYDHDAVPVITAYDGLRFLLPM